MSLSVTALAAPSAEDKAAADALFDAGKRLFSAGNNAAACEKFAASQQLDPGVGTLMYLADCYGRIGKTASAWATWREAAAAARDAGQTEREATARKHAAQLEPALSRLVVVVPSNVRVPGLVVQRDGVVVRQAAWGVGVPVDPGSHPVEAKAPGRLSWSSQVDVASGPSQATVTIPLLAADSAPATASMSTELRSESKNARSHEPDAGVSAVGATQRAVGYATLGLGAVGLGAGVFFGLRRNDKLDERDGVCPTQRDCTEQDATRNASLTDEARTAGNWATVGFVAGGIGLAGGAILLLTAPTGPSATEVGALRVTPWVSSSQQGVAVNAAW
jgi:hypothetical protein